MKRIINGNSIVSLYVMLFAICLPVLFGIASCPKPATPIAVCQEVAGPSLLEQYIPDLKMADTLFKLAVLEIGKLKQVQQADIAKVLDEAESLVNQGTTYDGLIMYLLPKFKWIRENCGAEVVILGEYFTSFQGVQTPLTAKDQCYLKAHIQSQRQKVLPWIQMKK